MPPASTATCGGESEVPRPTICSPRRSWSRSNGGGGTTSPSPTRGRGCSESRPTCCGEQPQGHWGSPTPEFIAGLTRDPEQLLAEIRQYAGDAGPSPDGGALVVVGGILRSGIVPGDVRAALFEAAALIPGVELVDDQANLNGQTGVAVGRYEPNNGTRQEIIFDPDTGMVIGQRDVLVDYGMGPLLPVGTAAGWTAVVTEVVPASMVDQIPADPRD